PGLPPIQLPTVEIIAFSFNMSLSNRRTREVTRLFPGPAVLDRLAMYSTLPNADPPPYFTISINSAPEAESNQDLQTNVPPTTGRVVVTEVLRAVSTQVLDPAIRGFLPAAGANEEVASEHRLGTPILEESFSLSFEVTSQLGSAGSVWGSLRLLTNVDRELLLNFL
ncbi:MAG: hypothetical protein ACE5JH_12590, partial [Acidobacteriota bacterium]